MMEGLGARDAGPGAQQPPAERQFRTRAAADRYHRSRLGPSAKDVSATATIGVDDQHDYRQEIVVSHPAIWSLEERNIYKLLTEVQVEGKAVDRYETAFGIRSVQFDAKQGFLLNGAPVKLKGTCNHQDHAGVGAALPDAVQYYRVRKLQEMGCNSLRTSHNPPTPELLDACDQLGMLLMDETRMMSSNPEGLSQFEHLALAFDLARGQIVNVGAIESLETGGVDIGLACTNGIAQNSSVPRNKPSLATSSAYFFSVADHQPG